MNRRCRFLLVSFFLAGLWGRGLAAPPASGEAGTPRRPSVLAGVKGLEAPVTLAEAKIPLGELVQKVAEETGAALTAGQDVADEPIALAVKRFPASRLLAEVADLLDYQWSRRGKEGAWRYEIWQDLASKQREAALREALVRDAEKRFREELKRYAEIAALPQAEFERLSREAQQHWQAWQKLTPEEQQARLQTDAGRERNARFGAVQELQPPIRRAIAALLGPLPARQWERLRDGGSLTLSTEPKSGELRLPLEAERRLRAARPTYLRPGARLAFPDPKEEERLRRLEQSLQEGWAAASGYRVHVRLDTNRLTTQGSLLLNAYAVPFRGGVPLNADLPPVGGGGSGIELTLWTSARDFLLLPEPDPPERRAALARDPVLGSAKEFRPELKPRPSANGPLAPGTWGLRELMPDLARIYGVQFIADAYWASNPGFTTTEVPAGPTALWVLMDRATRPNHHWERRGDLVRIRSRTWFLDRPREIPLRLVRRWQAQINAHAALPLEEYAAMVTSLSDVQLETLSVLDDLLGFPQDFSSAAGGREALRLYAALPKERQKKLRQGEEIAVAGMLAGQREQFLRALRHAASLSSTEVDPEQLARATFSIRSEPGLRVRERRGAAVTYRDEREAMPAGDEEAAKRPDHASRGARETARDAGRPVPRDPTAGVTQHPVTSLRFYCQYAGERYEAAFVTVARR